MNNPSKLTRCIDDLGRIVIPKAIRAVLAINEGDTLEITVSSQGILIRKIEE
jgi:AbrB family looped-hinge helix DNA binding protein